MACGCWRVGAEKMGCLAACALAVHGTAETLGEPMDRAIEQNLGQRRVRWDGEPAKREACATAAVPSSCTTCAAGTGRGRACAWRVSEGGGDGGRRGRTGEDGDFKGQGWED